MSHPIRIGGARYAPAVHGGLVDSRSTSAPGSKAPRPTLNDRRSTR
ncbi:hypothetical protein [uncultured Phenylobacterium sp.]|nr:hypothetical protein [uncultured Phenylobacterium sp.]